MTSIDRYQLDALGDDDLAAHSQYAYDDQGNMTSLSDTQGTTELAGYAWTYDADGRVTDAYSYTDTTYTTHVHQRPDFELPDVGPRALQLRCGGAAQRHHQ